MAGRLGDVPAVAAHLVGECAGVSVLSVEFFWSTWLVDDVPGGPRPVGPSLRIMEARVHARTWAGAQVVAERFGLVETCGEYARLEFSGGAASEVWRQWSGWLPDVSRDYPVSVRVVAAGPVDALPSDQGARSAGALVA